MINKLNTILEHAGVLQRATTLRELVALTFDAVRSSTRYKTAWLALLEPEDPNNLRIVQVEGLAQEIVLEKCPRVPIAGDAMLHELIDGKAPVIVLDAPNDPRTNKAMVAALGNRTILNVPLVLGPVIVGALGVGTFGDEGIMPPLDDELDALVVLGTQLAGAITRMQLVDKQRAEAERRMQLERHIESLQRVEMMGVLAAGVAHDLNNFLLVVRGNLELLDLKMPGMDVEAVETALHATLRASDVVQQLLSLGRARSAQREAVDLNARVVSTVQLVRASMSGEITLTHGADQHTVVDGDPVQIEQAVANLLINARDAVGKSGHIDVDVSERELNDDFVRTNTWARSGRFGRVQVRDTGVGIAPEVLARIFDPLFSTKSSGTGLGLAVVSRVAEQHGGFVHCESVLGAGTTFDLYLPMERSA